MIYKKLENPDCEIVINWHMIEACNYACTFCFAKWDRLKPLAKDLNKAKKLIDEVAKIARRINFAGGEPFLLPQLGELMKYASEKAHLKVSFISNGSRTENSFIKKYGHYIDMAGFSIDAPDEETTIKIGRVDGNQKTVSIKRIKDITDKFRERNPNIKIKINTVVCNENKNSDMHSVISLIKPERWKVFRVLPVINKTEKITDEEWESFIRCHKDIPVMVSENNHDMQASYLMVDPAGRFYDNHDSISNDKAYHYSSPILEVGIKSALNDIHFDLGTYKKRYHHD